MTSETSKWFPNRTPQHETVVDDALSFVEACRARIVDDVERDGLRLGRSIVTRSEEWGLVWWVDMLGEFSGDRGRRIICWQLPDSDGIGFALVYVDHTEKL